MNSIIRYTLALCLLATPALAAPIEATVDLATVNELANAVPLPTVSETYDTPICTLRTTTKVHSVELIRGTGDRLGYRARGRAHAKACGVTASAPFSAVGTIALSMDGGALRVSFGNANVKLTLLGFTFRDNVRPAPIALPAPGGEFSTTNGERYVVYPAALAVDTDGDVLNLSINPAIY